MAQKIHYTYHWKRIFGALTMLALLVFLVSYGVYSLLETENPVEQPDEALLDLNNETTPKDHSQPQSDISPRTLADQNTLLHSPDVTDQNESQQQPDKPSIEPAAISPHISEEERLPIIRDESDSFPVEVKVKSIESQPVMETSKVEVEAKAEVETEVEAEAEAEAVAAAEVETEAEVEVEVETNQPLSIDRTQPSQQSNPDHARQQGQQKTPTQADLLQDRGRGKPFQQQEVKKISPSVKRFILARSIRGREPIDSIDLITIDTEGVAVIYAFSEVINMSGSTLYYHWFHNMKQKAKVRVGVGSNSWRSFSSKYINNKMQGSWLVELRTADGQILASGRFFVRIP